MTQAPLPAPRRFTPHLPFFILLLVQLGIGLFTFRDYGLAWDEPLFYEYADALGYAYTPANWTDPDFDLARAYGPSGDDHKTRGPAYLLLARTPVHLLESLGADEASAWHLVNFLTFLLGVYFVYRLSLRWMRPWAAFGAAALFSTQPLLLGHAFINPKDMPFLVFFTGALLYGFEAVERIFSKPQPHNFIFHLSSFILPAFFLGIATSIRVLAPLAGILIVIYAILRHSSPVTRHSPLALRSFIFLLSSFILLSILFMLATWPYLWEAPLARFIEVFGFMSENPTGLQVLFGGEIYRAYELPRRYLPTLLAIMLTEPVWVLFLIGFLVRAVGDWKSQLRLAKSHLRGTQPAEELFTNHWSLKTDYWLLLASFLIPSAYVLLLRPPMYDGFRHFLFILPPVFVTCGLGLDAIFGWLEKLNGRIRSISWLRAVIVFSLLLPGLVAFTDLHPYEYTYYNSFVRGTGGAYRSYETDYWLTCYKEAVERFDTRPANLFVHREAYIAAAYASSGLTILEERGNLSNVRSGDYILVNTRSNEDRKTFHDAPVVIEVGRVGATFCVIKRVP